MNSYEIYRLYDGDKTATKRSVELRDDLDALAAAKKEAPQQDVEVWEGKRFVARVKKNDAALDARDTQSL